MNDWERPWCYRLEGHTPVAVTDLDQWGTELEASDRYRRVGGAQWHEPDVWVSTVFLGVDHNHYGQGPPILFETMIFAPRVPEVDQEQRRYRTWDEAAAGHAAVVAELASAFGPPDEEEEEG